DLLHRLPVCPLVRSARIASLAGVGSVRPQAARARGVPRSRVSLRPLVMVWSKPEHPKGRIMRYIANGIAMAVALVASTVAAVGPPTGPLSRCAMDAVVAGAVCMDKYEASVWRVPNPTTTNVALARKIQLGRASLADLTAGGATQLGTRRADYAPCTPNGQSCANDI